MNSKTKLKRCIDRLELDTKSSDGKKKKKWDFNCNWNVEINEMDLEEYFTSGQDNGYYSPNFL